MTSTSVKDVGSVLSTLGVSAGAGTKAEGSIGFQTIFNGQTGKEAVGSRTDNVQAKSKKAPGDSLKAKDDHMARVSEKKTAGAAKDEEEFSNEKLNQAAEVLGAAALDMMQQIADALGMSMEELQGAMEELGMEGLNVLDRENLGALLLELAGAEDVYALVTDGELYGTYQELMAKLEDALGQAGEQLELTPGQLEDVMRQLEDAKDQEIPVDDVAGTILAEDAEQTVGEPKNTGVQAENDAIAGQQAAQPQEAAEVPRDDMEQQSDSRQRHSQDREHPGMFAQAFRAESFLDQFRPGLQQTQGISGNWGTDTQDIMRQIMDYMRIQVKVDTSSLEMQLHPASLGTLHIQVASRGGVLTANFITQSEAVKTALESQMVQLRESFEQQGVKVEAIEVTVQSHAFERNLEQGRGQSGEQSQPEKRTRTRRIDLNNPLDVEELEEEDALAAEMMAASGSQVDYTV